MKKLMAASMAVALAGMMFLGVGSAKAGDEVTPPAIQAGDEQGSPTEP